MLSVKCSSLTYRWCGAVSIRDGKAVSNSLQKWGGVRIVSIDRKLVIPVVNEKHS